MTVSIVIFTCSRPRKLVSNKTRNRGEVSKFRHPRMEILETAECFTGYDEDLVFSHTIVILKNGEDFFFARVQGRYQSTADINPELLEPLTQIPVEAIWPPYSVDLTEASKPLPLNSYIKHPALVGYDEGDDFLSNALLQEAQIYEILRTNPHPNIAQYRGCVVRKGRITGLCLAKYDLTLADRLKDLKRPLDVEGCLDGIRYGIQHLHSLGLIHNDVKPLNIMFNADDNIPIIIDFDLCQPEGEELRGLGCGTIGWSDPSRTHATTENDYYGLRMIREAME